MLTCLSNYSLEVLSPVVQNFVSIKSSLMTTLLTVVGKVFSNTDTSAAKM